MNNVHNYIAVELVFGNVKSPAVIEHIANGRPMVPVSTAQWKDIKTDDVVLNKGLTVSRDGDIVHEQVAKSKSEFKRLMDLVTDNWLKRFPVVYVILDNVVGYTTNDFLDLFKDHYTSDDEWDTASTSSRASSVVSSESDAPSDVSSDTTSIDSDSDSDTDSIYSTPDASDYQTADIDLNAFARAVEAYGGNFGYI